ncbi:MAG: DUF3396 domain-containing protein [Gammaproteobacteria bacterium]|nr:DUF3396 domain-containing protein [Gammaproteobacteria bacterium]
MQETEAVFEKLKYEEKDFTYIKPCLDITFFWAGSIFECSNRSNDVIEFYQQCLDILGGNIKYYRTETMTKSKPLKKDTLDLLPFWFKNTKSRRDIYMLFLESSSTPDEPSDYAFALNAAPDNGYIRLVLPISFISKSVDSFLDLATNMGKMSSYNFGQAGFALNWNFLGKNIRGILREMNSFANRYPGLDMSDPFCTKYIASKGIKCANWLTFLNADYCGCLGGVDELNQRFDDNIIIHEAHGEGVMIQAGSFPEIGDVNRQRNTPNYHHVGKVLAPIRCKEHPPIFGPQGIGDREITEQWLSRFDV